MNTLHRIFYSTVSATLVVTALAGCDRRDEVAMDSRPTESATDGASTDMTASADQDAAQDRTAPGAAGAGGTGVSTDDATVAGLTRDSHPAATHSAAASNMNMTMDPPAAGLSNQTPLARDDQQFIRKAAQSGLYEVEMAKLGVERAQDQSVKDMAARLLDDHRAANDKLQQVASGRMSIPTDIPADKRAVIDRLSKVSAANFDREFVQTVGIKDHQADIQLFEKTNAKDPTLKDFIVNTLPTLKLHQSSAEDLKRKLGDKS